MNHYRNSTTQGHLRLSVSICQLLTSYKTLTTGRWVWTILGRLSSTGRWLEGRVLKHRWSCPSWTTEREWIWTSQWLHWKLAAQQNCVVHSSSQQRANKRLCKPVALRLRSRSCDGRKPVGVFAVVPACGEGAVTGAGGSSKQPKASCHALLNSLVPPAAPGLSRSCRKASSPLSPSSSFTHAESRASDNRSRPKKEDNKTFTLQNANCSLGSVVLFSGTNIETFFNQETITLIKTNLP